MKRKVLRHAKKVCVLATVISMVTTFAACGSAEEQVSDSSRESAAAVTEAPAKATPAPTVTEAPIAEPTAEPTPEPTPEPTMEPIDISKLVKKQITYNEEGTATDTYTYTYNEMGLLAKEEYIDIYNWEGQPQITEYTYDTNGKLSKKEFHASDGAYFYETEILTYNADGNVTKDEYESSGMKRVIDYVYDESGKLVEENFETDGLSTKTCYEYDEHGNLINQRTWVDGEEGEGRSYKYEYYADGIVKRKESYSGEKLSTVEEYHENGARRMKESISSEGACTERCEYDENDRLVLRVEYAHRYDEWIPKSEYRYTYSEADNTITTTQCDLNTNATYEKVEMQNREFSEYDENGVLVSLKIYSNMLTEDGPKLNYLYEYEYDEAGNLVKETCYDGQNGEVEDWIEYIY